MLFCLTGCFEIIEDTTIHEDGSGEYKLTLNLSASQTRLNSLMALDSIDGKKVPSEAEMKQEIAEFTDRMNATSGISNATCSLSTEDWILKFSCSFDSLTALKKSIREASQKWNKTERDKEHIDQIVLTFNENIYSRQFSANINEKMRAEVRADEDYGKLSEGKCVFIQRFDQTIKSVDHENVRIAKNQKASMLMVSPIQIFKNPKILDYSVHLNP